MVQKEIDKNSSGLIIDGIPIVEAQYKKKAKYILDVLDKISKRKETEMSIKIPNLQAGAHNVKPCVTVWFNAWKYESTEQVWADLADSIVKQIVLRLNPEEREEFLFELHLRRQNIDKIRQKIYENILSRWWQKTRPWLGGFITAIGISAITSILGWEGIIKSTDDALNSFLGLSGTGGIILSILGGAITSFKNYQDVKNETAELVAGEFLDMPDYSGNLGFIHHVEEDLRRVFETIPNDNRSHTPLVIFIDDLDRCSPEKIADIFEGINLFLAGEFQNCIFILGMDPNIVAAALEEAHSRVIDKLPKYSMHTNIGWRFMDKFIQLQFMIPVAEEQDLNRYVDTLLVEGINQNALKNQIGKDPSDTIGRNSYESKRGENIEAGLPHVRNMQETRYVLGKQERSIYYKERNNLQKTDELIDNFSDKNPKIRELISIAVKDFSSNNPRLSVF